MKNYLRIAFVALALCATTTALNAGTIIKLNLGETGPDVSMVQGGTFGTTNDGNAGTIGDQNTAIEYADGLDFIPDINLNVASFSLTGLQEVGPAGVFGNLVVQNLVGGIFNLYDPANNLLLSGALTNSALTGVLAPGPGTGSVFTTAPITGPLGGALAPFIVPGSLSLSLTLTNVVSQGITPGLVVDGGVLQFTADSTVEIAATTVVPEPTTLGLLAFGGLAALGLRLRRR